MRRRRTTPTARPAVTGSTPPCPPGAKVTALWDQRRAPGTRRAARSTAASSGLYYRLMLTELFNPSIETVHRFGGTTIYENHLPTVPGSKRSGRGGGRAGWPAGGRTVRARGVRHGGAGAPPGGIARRYLRALADAAGDRRWCQRSVPGLTHGNGLSENPRAQPSDSRALRDRCPLVADRACIATARGPATFHYRALLR